MVQLATRAGPERKIPTDCKYVSDLAMWLDNLHRGFGSPFANWCPKESTIIGVDLGKVLFQKPERGDVCTHVMADGKLVALKKTPAIKYNDLLKRVWIVSNNHDVEKAKLSRKKTEETFNISRKIFAREAPHCTI